MSPCDVSYLVSVIDPAIDRILEAAPEFVDRYLALVEAADGDPGAAAAFTELADFVADLVAGIERHRPALTRCLAGVESVAATSAEAQELVAWAFLDSLTPEDRRVLAPWLGPRTRSLLEEIDPGPPTAG
jgi:hypothetical protein